MLDTAEENRMVMVTKKSYGDGDGDGSKGPVHVELLVGWRPSLLGSFCY